VTSPISATNTDANNGPTPGICWIARSQPGREAGGARQTSSFADPRGRRPRSGPGATRRGCDRPWRGGRSPKSSVPGDAEQVRHRDVDAFFGEHRRRPVACSWFAGRRAWPGIARARGARVPPAGRSTPRPRRPSRSRSARSSASRVSFFTRRFPPAVAERMGEVDLAAELVEQIGRPVPPVTSFKNDLGCSPAAMTACSKRAGRRCRPWSPRGSHPRAAPDDDAPAPVCRSIPTYCRCLFHWGPPSSWSDWFCNPEVFHSRLHDEGGPHRCPSAHPPGRRREQSHRTDGPAPGPGRACGKRRCSPGSAARRRTAPRSRALVHDVRSRHSHCSPSGVGAGPHHPGPSRESGVALLHHIRALVPGNRIGPGGRGPWLCGSCSPWPRAWSSPSPSSGWPSLASLFVAREELVGSKRQAGARASRRTDRRSRSVLCHARVPGLASDGCCGTGLLGGRSPTWP